jgi:hypothetical protein
MRMVVVVVVVVMVVQSRLGGLVLCVEDVVRGGTC